MKGRFLVAEAKGGCELWQTSWENYVDGVRDHGAELVRVDLRKLSSRDLASSSISEEPNEEHVDDPFPALEQSMADQESL